MSVDLTFLDEYRPDIERALADATLYAVDCPARLAQAIRYALLAPGKRLRPLLVLLAAEACGGTRENALPAAVAVEMIHAYSLIHDDLPAMDDDDLRRGRPTTHIEFDEATAILAGDALQAEAFGHLYRNVSDRDVLGELVGQLATAAGACGLVGGQADDLAAEKMTRAEIEKGQPVLEFAQAIHRRKTGALFVASLVMGATTAGANADQLAALRQYGCEIGLAFQITDDVLDCTAEASEIGKQTGKDIGRGKLVYPVLMISDDQSAENTADDSTMEEGVRLARHHARECVDRAIESLELFGDSGQRLIKIAKYVLERTK